MAAPLDVVACVDIGSTWSKAALVSVDSGELLGTAQSPTTIDDVVRGVLAATSDWPGVPVLACSSAGGGLRLAVVGYEELISAEAGHRAALSAGARVVHVAAGRLDDEGLAALDAAAPDVVLLVGGTDGGEASVLRHNAAMLALHGSVPIVLAGNTAVRDEVAAVLRAGGRPVIPTANVLPDIGMLVPEPARAAIRSVFLEHVIGGDRLSTDPRLRRWVRAVTPDAVLEGVSVLASLCAAAEVAGVVVVDVGGATTDVYCVPGADAEQAALGREAVGVPARRRTVEGDLGVAASVDALRSAAAAEGLTWAEGPASSSSPEACALPTVVGRAQAFGDPLADRLVLGEAAATVALRRHLRAEAAYGPGGAGARAAGLVVLSGGVFRHADAGALDLAVARLAADSGGAGGVLTGAEVVVDRRYVLAAVGLLAAEHPVAAAGLARTLLPHSHLSR